VRVAGPPPPPRLLAVAIICFLCSFVPLLVRPCNIYLLGVGGWEKNNNTSLAWSAGFSLASSS